MAYSLSSDKTAAFPVRRTVRAILSSKIRYSPARAYRRPGPRQEAGREFEADQALPGQEQEKAAALPPERVTEDNE